MKYWDEEVPFAITVCDKDGIIVRMNEKSCTTFAQSGGYALVGTDLRNCHPEAARNKLDDLLTHPQVNCYTIEKNGIRKMIYQAPVYENGEFAGLVEISLPIPADIPHFKRT